MKYFLSRWRESRAGGHAQHSKQVLSPLSSLTSTDNLNYLRSSHQSLDGTLCQSLLLETFVQMFMNNSGRVYIVIIKHNQRPYSKHNNHSHLTSLNIFCVQNDFIKDIMLVNFLWRETFILNLASFFPLKKDILEKFSGKVLWRDFFRFNFSFNPFTDCTWSSSRLVILI